MKDCKEQFDDEFAEFFWPLQGEMGTQYTLRWENRFKLFISSLLQKQREDSDMMKSCLVTMADKLGDCECNPKGFRHPKGCHP